MPLALGSATAPGTSHACLVFDWGILMPRLAKMPCSHSSSSGSTVGSRPVAAAMASRVRSSGVGPKPPVEITRSAVAIACLKESATSCRSSGKSVVRRTSTPSSVSARARSPLLVSRVQPLVSSLPILFLRSDLHSKLPLRKISTINGLE